MDVAPYRLSVVMPVRDRFDMACTALGRVVGQTRAPHEVVIVDDGSATPFEGRAAGLVRAAAERGIPVKFHRNEASTGVSAARNLGVAASAGDLICFCDSDDYWVSRKLEVVAQVFDANRRIEALCHPYVWEGGRSRNFDMFRPGQVAKLPRWLLLCVSLVNPSCFCLKKSVFGSGFREEMRHHEDLEFVLRLARRHDIWVINEPLTEMGRPPGSAGGASNDARAMRRGAVRALRLNLDWRPVHALSVLKIAYHQSLLWWGDIRGRSKVR